jgi:curved DNA-binding protein CbpA
MSAPIAGKFQDHYATLGVETNADLSALQRVHAELTEKYHPANRETGDTEKLEAVQIAFEVLSDPELRKSFDMQKGVGGDTGAPKFSGIGFFNAFDQETGLRIALLCVLYDRRRSKPFTPSLSVRHVENILTVGGEQLASVLWYLKQRNLVASDDKSNLLITVDGMDYLEVKRPSAETVMPWIRSASPAAPRTPAPVPEPAGEPVATPVASGAMSTDDHARRSAVNRILSRGMN